MKFYYKPNSKMTFEVEAANIKELVDQSAAVMELIENCGKCHTDDVAFQVRKSKDADGEEYSYYELKCRKCGAILAFGSHRATGGETLFPIRYEKNAKGKPKNDAEGNRIWLADRGWTKWDKEQNKRV
jgi:hypothetical protein